MSVYRKVRSKLYHSSDYLQYLWERRTFKKIRKEFEQISDRDFAIRHYRQVTGKDLSLGNPQTFDEKLWYLKLNNRDPLLTICSDKYRVREYVERCGLSHILNEQYGVFDDARIINFNTLPSPCFLKCNHTSGTNIIFDRTKPFPKRSFIRKFNFMLKQNYFWVSREWNYKNIEPKIVAERVLKNKDGSPLHDYRFMCFSGVPKFMMMDIDTCTEDGAHSPDARRNIYDENMKLLEVTFSRARHDIPIPLSHRQFEEMKSYAAILSEPFPLARIDFYCVDAQVWFGEITFYHAGGCNNIQPHEWDLKIASWIDINNIKREN